MIDQFAIVLTHGLLALAALRLVMRDDLDADRPNVEERPPQEEDARRA